jgi:hypothetical protein
MWAYWASGGIVPCILDLGTRWRRVVSFRRRPLYPQGKSPWYPLDRRLGGPQSRSGHGGEQKNSQPLPGVEPPIIQPVAQCYTAELRSNDNSRFLYDSYSTFPLTDIVMVKHPHTSNNSVRYLVPAKRCRGA